MNILISVNIQIIKKKPNYKNAKAVEDGWNKPSRWLHTRAPTASFLHLFSPPELLSYYQRRHEKYLTNRTLQSWSRLPSWNGFLLFRQLWMTTSTKFKKKKIQIKKRHVIPLEHRTFFFFPLHVGNRQLAHTTHTDLARWNRSLCQISACVGAFSGQVGTTLSIQTGVAPIFFFFFGERFRCTWRVSTSTSYLRTAPAARNLLRCLCSDQILSWEWSFLQISGNVGALVAEMMYKKNIYIKK